MRAMRFALAAMALIAIFTFGKGFISPVVAFANDLVDTRMHQTSVSTIVFNDKETKKGAAPSMEAAPAPNKGVEKKVSKSVKVEKPEKEKAVEKPEKTTEETAPALGDVTFVDNMQGVLYIPFLDVKEPVMQGEDNEYYLHHDINGAKSVSGSVFLQAGKNIESSSSFFVFGHNMRNGSMFGKLDRIESADRQKVYLYTQSKIYVYEIADIQDRDAKSSNISNTEFKDGTMILYTCEGVAGGTMKRLVICERVAVLPAAQ